MICEGGGKGIGIKVGGCGGNFGLILGNWELWGGRGKGSGGQKKGFGVGFLWRERFWRKGGEGIQRKLKKKKKKG